jgi:cytochrome c oxidase subunit II
VIGPARESSPASRSTSRSSRIPRLRAAATALVALTMLPGCVMQGATSKATEVHDLFWLISWLALPVFVAVEGFLLWCAFRYRKRDDSPAPQRTGRKGVLISFFAIGLVIVAVLFVFGERTLATVDKVERNTQVDIRLEAFQWEWTAYYKTEGLVVSGKTLKQPLVFELPVDEPVRIELVARDVMHEFFVPAFLFMRNAIPGHPNVFTLTPDKLGTFQGQCAQYCGLWHSRMTFILKVVSTPDYLNWVKQERVAILRLTCPEHTGSVSVTAKNIAWNTNCISIGDQEGITLTVANLDQYIDHNFAIYDSPLRKQRFFQTGQFAGVQTRSFQLPILPPGRYYFQCDVHGPGMSGVFIVNGHATPTPAPSGTTP